MPSKNRTNYLLFAGVTLLLLFASALIVQASNIEGEEQKTKKETNEKRLNPINKSNFKQLNVGKYTREQKKKRKDTYDKKEAEEKSKLEAKIRAREKAEREAKEEQARIEQAQKEEQARREQAKKEQAKEEKEEKADQQEVKSSSKSLEGTKETVSSESKGEAKGKPQNVSKPSNGTYLGTFEATAYAIGDGLTPNTYTRDGTDVSNTIYGPDGHRIIATDPNVIPTGTVVRVTINGNSFVATARDTGSAINGNIIDILVSSPDEAYSFGRQHGIEVTILN